MGQRVCVEVFWLRSSNPVSSPQHNHGAVVRGWEETRFQGENKLLFCSFSLLLCVCVCVYENQSEDAKKRKGKQRMKNKEREIKVNRKLLNFSGRRCVAC